MIAADVSRPGSLSSLFVFPHLRNNIVEQEASQRRAVTIIEHMELCVYQTQGI